MAQIKVSETGRAGRKNGSNWASPGAKDPQFPASGDSRRAHGTGLDKMRRQFKRLGHGFNRLADLLNLAAVK
jgi:hypothetical protein